MLVAPLPAEAQRLYVVRAGDTLSSIARRHRLAVGTLRRANNLRGDAIREGMRLRLPGSGAASASARSGTHRVRPGETLSAIAARYRVAVTALRRENRLRGDRIREGAVLRIPGRGFGTLRPQGVRPATPTPAQEQAEARALAIGLGSAAAGHGLLIAPPDPAWLAYAREGTVAPAEASPGVTTAASDPMGRHSRELEIPIEGATFLRGWGSGPGGYHLAVDFGAPRGTPVHAVDAGVVAYAGNGVRGYGNLVLLLHASGAVSGYAHNHQIHVVGGQRVRRGEEIAEVGDTGFARGPHLHFMWIDDGTHCDPMPLFVAASRPGIETRSDHEGARALAAPPAALHDRSGAPLAPTVAEAVRCLPRSSRPHPGRSRRGRSRRQPRP